MTWRERIEKAKAVGFFSERDKEDADDWDSDPIGEMISEDRAQFSCLVNHHKSPIDRELKRFSFEFMDAVERDEPELAGELLGLIERTAEALAKKEPRQ